MPAKRERLDAQVGNARGRYKLGLREGMKEREIAGWAKHLRVGWSFRQIGVSGIPGLRSETWGTRARLWGPGSPPTDQDLSVGPVSGGMCSRLSLSFMGAPVSFCGRWIFSRVYLLRWCASVGH